MASQKEKVVRRGVSLYLDGQEIKNDVKSIEDEMRKLVAQQKRMTIGSEEYVAASAKIKSLKAILAEHNAQLKQVSTTQKFTLSRGVDLFNKYAASVAAVAAALTGVVMKMNTFRKLFSEREDAKANVEALTGLSKKNIAWLEEQAVVLSTTMEKSGLRIRKSATEIMQAYMMVGSNKPELLKDKEALNAVTIEAMRLAEASGMDLKAAVNATTTAMNQYGAAANQAAKYVNVLAAGSKVGASNVEEVNAAVLKAGTIAAASNISIEQLVGAIETLGEKGIKNEVAGTGLKTFFTKLATGAADTNPKIVGLTKALDTLSDKVKAAEAQQAGGGATLLKKLFGDEGMTTAMILTQNAKALREYTKEVTNTHIAVEQAAINSDTPAAAKAQRLNELNEIGIQLVKELNPLLVKLLGQITNLSRGGVTLVRVITEHRAALSLLTTGIALYVAWGYRKVVVDKLMTMWSSRLVISMAKNPYVLAALAIGTLVGALIDYNRKAKQVTETNKAMQNISKKTTEEYGEQITRFRTLNFLVHNANLSLEARKKALIELNAIVPGYNASLSEEGKLIEGNTQALKDYISNLEHSIRLKAAEEEMDELGKKQWKAERDLKDKEAKLEKAKAALNAAKTATNLTPDKFSTPGMNMLSKGLDNSISHAETYYRAAKKEVEKSKAALEEVNAALDEVKEEVSKAYAGPVSTPKPEETPIVQGAGGGTGGTAKKEDAVKKELLEIEKKYYYQRMALKKAFIENDELSQSDYAQFSKDLVMQELQDKLKVLGLEPEQVRSIQEKIMDIRLEAAEKCRDEELKILTETQQEKIRLLQKQFKEEMKEIDSRNLRTSKDYETAEKDRRQIAQKYANLIMAETVLTEEQKAQLIEDINTKTTDGTKNATKEQIEAIDVVGQYAMSTAQSIGQTLAEFFTDEEKSFSDFSKALLKTVLDSVEKAILAYEAQIMAREIAEKSWGGVASAAALSALIAAAFETAKGVIGNFWTGGFTGSGAWDEPKGVVHSNEFVANRFAVANPAVRPVLNLIDAAQRTNSISSLSASDIAAVSQNGTHAQQSGVGDMAVVRSMVNNLSRVITRLNQRLDEPFTTINTVSGKNGVKAQLDEYDKMINNVSRTAKS